MELEAKGGGELKYAHTIVTGAPCVPRCKIEDHTSFEEDGAAGDAGAPAALSLHRDVVVLPTWQNSSQKGPGRIVDLHISEAPAGRYRVIHNTTRLVPGDLDLLTLTGRLSRYNDRLAGL